MVIDSPSYKAALSANAIARAKNTELEVVTSQNGFRLGTSIDGSLMGRGGDLIIVDDPLKPADALNEVRRSYVNNWFTNTLLTRLDDMTTGAIIVVMQRLHEEDLTGALLRSSNEWVLLSLPAIAEVDQPVQIGPTRSTSSALAISFILSGCRAQSSRRGGRSIPKRLRPTISKARYRQVA